jgi:hypothetical protein
MKVRNGFVTNSSSSSFIIAIKGGIEGLDTLVDVENPVWKEFIINGIKQLMESDGEYGDTSAANKMSESDFNNYYEEGSTMHKKLTKLHKDGFVIYSKSFDYNDAGGHTLKKVFKNNTNFVVIDEN